MSGRVRRKTAEKVEKAEKRVPSLHLVTMLIAAGLELVLLLCYLFATPEKTRFLEILLPMPMVFLFGKFTNGFPKPGQEEPPAPPVREGAFEDE